MEKEIKDKYAFALNEYIKDKHTQEECCGFMDGFKQAIIVLKSLQPKPEGKEEKCKCNPEYSEVHSDGYRRCNFCSEIMLHPF